MNPVRRFGIAAVIAAMALLVTSGVALAECGKVTVGEMNWNSARVIANVEKFVLETGYGCEVELVQTSTVPAMTSMVEKGEPDIASEIWINSVRESFESGVAEDRIVSAGSV
ncbi:MAG: glycine/betaine ABC transporter substrate-binding protein, partial [Rhodospirillaceae bacterium]|nr:glycine/betaine ABC transporter substrate-binding protein [Rhodospirillaceae bacterium]